MVELESDITIEVAIMRKLDAMHHILTDILNDIGVGLDDSSVSLEVIRTRLDAIEVNQSHIRLELGTTRAEVALKHQDYGD